MSLKSRLSHLQHQAGSGHAAPVSKPAPSDLRDRLARLRLERLQAGTTGHAAMSVEELARRLDAEPFADGVLHIHESIPLDHLATNRMQETTLAEPRSRYPQPLLPGETGTAALRHAYLDTETTGLAGGSGTLAFLIGIAVVSEDALDLSQFLLTRFAAEAALLAAFARTLSSADRLVSYNGKSYDLPLLAGRFRMQGLVDPCTALPHLDLLHPVRRLFGSRWQDCRLLTLEKELLGFRRRDDLPGSEAPAAWFDYIRRGDGERLVRVVEHNHQDIVSLAAAHQALAQAVREPQAFDVDLTTLARWLAECDEEAARALLQRHQASLDEAGKRLLARFSRRAGNWHQAVTMWEALAVGGCTESLEHLAKYHEHISGDLAAARHCCERLPGGPSRQQRRARIERKLLARGADPTNRIRL